MGIKENRRGTQSFNAFNQSLYSDQNLKLIYFSYLLFFFYLSSRLLSFFLSISQEDGKNTLLYAHLFAIDHLVTTAYTALFAVVWYVYVPHDGRRVANSDAQKEMMGLGGELLSSTSESVRKAAAEAIWKSERGFAAAVLVGGWLIKVR